MVIRSFYIIFLCFWHFLIAQESKFTIPNGDQSVLDFQLVNNLIIIPVEVNGIELSFILDSGVSKPILFNIINMDNSFRVKESKKIYLRGLGGNGAVEALKSNNNVFKIGDAINSNQDLFLIYDNSINFTPRLGVNVHGIIGFDFLKDFVVEIKYINKRIRFYEPSSYKYKNCKKCKYSKLFLRNKKPYLDAEVTLDSMPILVKLLVDTGSSDALWLFEDESLGLKPHEGTFFIDFLGKGLSGDIHGKRSKISKFNLKGFELDNINVAYPDSLSITIARKFKERNGSIGGELLKRFNLIIDYSRSKITFKKNGNYKKPFYYNKAGIFLEQRGVRVVKQHIKKLNINDGPGINENNAINIDKSYNYKLVPSYEIIALREDSPAVKSGLEVGDIILNVNGKESHEYGLQEVMHKFYDRTGKQMRILVNRNGNNIFFKFRLEEAFSIKKPSK